MKGPIRVLHLVDPDDVRLEAYRADLTEEATHRFGTEPDEDADILQLLWPAPPHILGVLAGWDQPYRLVIRALEGRVPSGIRPAADVVLEGTGMGDWIVTYGVVMDLMPEIREAVNWHWWDVDEAGSAARLYLLAEGGDGCFFKRLHDTDRRNRALLARQVGDLRADLFEGPFGLEAWRSVFPEEPLFAWWTGLRALAEGRAATALFRFFRALEGGFRDRTMVYFIARAAATLGLHRLTRSAVRALDPEAPFADVDLLTRRHHGGPVQEHIYPLLPHVWRPDRICFDERFMLRALAGWCGLEDIRTVHVVGAHLFEEMRTFERLFPNLKNLILYEPNPEIAPQLEARFRDDPRVRVFACALSDEAGSFDFHIANNDGCSSSLLELGVHKEMSPEVAYTKTVPVTCRTLAEVIETEGLSLPDLLFLDVQGAEYQILSSLEEVDRVGIAMIFTEVSTTEIYKGGHTLEEIADLLEPDFTLLGYNPLSGHRGQHGNALFLHQVFRETRKTPVAPVKRPLELEEEEATALITHLDAYFFDDLRALREPERPLFIWGAGGMGRTLFPLLRDMGLQIAAFLDTDPAKEGKSLFDLPIRLPNCLAGPPEPRPFVVIGSSYRTEIEEDLMRMGYDPARDSHFPGFEILEAL